MSDQKDDIQSSNDSAAQPVDEIKNIKAEFSRKLENTTQQIMQQMQQFMSTVAQPKAAPAAKEEDLSELIYKDPAAYTARVLADAEARAEKKLNERAQAQAKQNAVINSLVAEFPELSDGSHSLTKRAVEIYNSMSDEERASPAGYKAAVKEAALDLDIKPKSKRAKAEEDSFSVGSGSAKSSKRASRDSGELDARTEEFARMMGLNVDDDKVRARLKSKHGRKSYNNWE